MSTLVHSRGEGVKIGSKLVHVVVEWPQFILVLLWEIERYLSRSFLITKALLWLIFHAKQQKDFKKPYLFNKSIAQKSIQLKISWEVQSKKTGFREIFSFFLNTHDADLLSQNNRAS